MICGGGIAGVEALLRLRRLTGDRVDVTVLSPQEEFVYRPLAVFEPFGVRAVCRYPLGRIAGELDATWVRDSLGRVDTTARRIRTAAGEELGYDALLLAVGAHESAPFEHAHVFSDRVGPHPLRPVVGALDAGTVSAIAFVVPNWPVWPVPLYELALLAAERAREAGRDVRITFLTPEPRPLKAFGQAAGEAMTARFAEAGIELRAGVVAEVRGPGVVSAARDEVRAETVVTLPRITGPALAGVGAGQNWFVPIDERCVVRGAGGRVFAAGDAADFPVKHGGIAAQQADTAVAGIAHLAGWYERPAPLAPMIRATVLTGNRALVLKARVVGGLGWQSTVSERSGASEHEKIRAEELGPYLAALSPALPTGRLRGGDQPTPSRSHSRCG